MRITSWNINSVRLRQDLIKQFIEHSAPDVLCLQETKTQNQFFPESFFHEMGYKHCVFAGQKSYNGVAIISKHPFQKHECVKFLENDEQRHICATLKNGLEIHNFYVPAGGDIPDPAVNPKFKDKLAFVDAMTQWSEHRKTDEKIIIVGDFNIAPLEHDVWSHKQLLNVVSHTPVEVTRLNALKASNDWVDAMREFVPAEEKLYSWWSYRARDWLASNRGRRLDHIWMSPLLTPALQSGDILSDARGWEKPSDHVPVTIELNEAA